jgi:hypothetical protein
LDTVFVRLFQETERYSNFDGFRALRLSTERKGMMRMLIGREQLQVERQWSEIASALCYSSVIHLLQF